MKPRSATMMLLCAAVMTAWSMAARTASTNATTSTAAGIPGIPKESSLRNDYRKLGLDVQDQGRRGSCMIFGTLNPLEFHLARQGKKERLSERFSTWAANNIRNTPGDTEGYSPAEVINGIRKYGYTTDRMFGGKYRDRGGLGRPDKEAIADAAKRTVIDVRFFGRATGFTDADFSAMCIAIATGFPVTVCLDWPKQISFGSGKIIKPWKKKPATGHCVIAVGYVLDKDRPGGGMFELRNSWGDNWGDDGYGFISFELLHSNITAAFTIATEAP